MMELFCKNIRHRCWTVSFFTKENFWTIYIKYVWYMYNNINQTKIYIKVIYSLLFTFLHLNFNCTFLWAVFTIVKLKQRIFEITSTWVTTRHRILSAFLAECQKCSMKKSVLKNFAKFTGKHLCQSLFFNQVGGLSLSIFLWILRNFYPAGMRCLWEISIRSPLKERSQRPLRNIWKEMAFLWRL